MQWEAWPDAQIASTVRRALAANADFLAREPGAGHAAGGGAIMGVPGSVLDRRVFPETDFVRRSPFLQTLLANPNHIGCHTRGESERFFAGTQAIERELLQLCAEEILGAEPGGWDGYVATGGTESNLQGLWLARNALRGASGEPPRQVGVLHSVDTHYSVSKGADLLGLLDMPVAVEPRSRAMTPASLAAAVDAGRARGVEAVVAVLNMGTTMFGTVDDPRPVWEALAGLPHVGHVDAAFGGFIYPFTTPDQSLNFADPRLVSWTLDAHKMLQAPYGTGIHLCRRGWIEHARTGAASYVRGGDVTLCGSRSGANAVAVWMILRAWGSDGGKAFCAELMARSDRLCAALDGLGVPWLRQPGMNIVALDAAWVPQAVADRFALVPDDHAAPRWYKVVVMDHVGDADIAALVDALAGSRAEAVASDAKSSGAAPVGGGRRRRCS